MYVDCTIQFKAIKSLDKRTATILLTKKITIILHRAFESVREKVVFCSLCVGFYEPNIVTKWKEDKEK